MELKDLIALPLILLTTLVGIALTTFSLRIRDAAFFLLVVGTALTERLDINFLSHYWYRGTSRGFEFTFVDILALSLLVACCLKPRYGAPRWFWPASLGLMLFYALYAAFSVGISDPKIFGLFELTKILRGIIIFVAAALYIRTTRELHLLVAALCCIVFFEGSHALKQRFITGLSRAQGSLDHANSLSMYLCMLSPMLVAAVHAVDVPRWLRWFCYAAIPFAAIGLVLTFSRAGVPIFAFVMLGTMFWCMSWRLTFARLGTTVLVMIAAAAFAAAAWGPLKQRFEASPLEEEYADKGEGRGVYLRWARLIMEDHFFGVGLNNWSYAVSKKYGADLGFWYEDYDMLGSGPYPEQIKPMRTAAPAHNLAALTVGELGVPGLLLFFLLWLRWLQMGATFLWRRFAGDPMYCWGVGLFFGTAGIFLQSITEWTYRQTPIFLLFNLLLGALASLYTLRQREVAPGPEEEPELEPEDEFATVEVAPVPMLSERN